MPRDRQEPNTNAKHETRAFVVFERRQPRCKQIVVDILYGPTETSGFDTLLTVPTSPFSLVLHSIMQFQFNSAYPQNADTVVDPLPFPDAQPTPCARITARILMEDQVTTQMVENVLVKISLKQSSSNGNKNYHDGSSSSSSSSDDDSDDDDDDDDDDYEGSSRMQVDGGKRDRYLLHRLKGSREQQQEAEQPYEDAYWLQRTIREAIYGRVLIAWALRRLTSTLWALTDEIIAVKEMSWHHIRKERFRLAEDPVQEVSAMQFLKQQFSEQRLLHGNGSNNGGRATTTTTTTTRATSSSTTTTTTAASTLMHDVNVLLPRDILSDQRYLYSVMPYCNGGELFERLDLRNERFSEPEARYWMDQLLNGLSHLQNVGVCHRDISLENILVHDDTISLIIDLGMCVRYPVVSTTSTTTTTTTTATLPPAVASLSIVDHNGTPSPPPLPTTTTSSSCLISPQGTCGKWIYMSPEIYKNKAFHGPTVDLWATGVILFLLLTGFPPWDRACDTDERYRYMSAGYLVQMLTEWNIPISADAMDLLQRMLFADPMDRLSLEQVRAHPWMRNGPRQAPTGTFDELDVAMGR
jgi:serine/threonine protein kinase